MKKYFFPHDHKPEHVKSLDGLRGIAVIIVLFGHGSFFGMDIHPSLSFLKWISDLGVLLFFLLSSFLLDRNIAFALRGEKAKGIYWVNYILRRFLRIFPLLFIWLITYYLLDRWFYPTFIYSIKEIGN